MNTLQLFAAKAEEIFRLQTKKCAHFFKMSEGYAYGDLTYQSNIRVHHLNKIKIDKWQLFYGNYWL